MAGLHVRAVGIPLSPQQPERSRCCCSRLADVGRAGGAAAGVWGVRPAPCGRRGAERASEGLAGL